MSLDDCRAREELNVAVVGATGLVGRELIALLAERSWPIATLSTFARVQSHVSISGETYAVQPLDLQRLRGHDVVFLAGTGELARRVVPSCGSDQLVIDNSSAFRMDPSVPLVIPEVNESDIGRATVIANPNCTTILLLTVLAPLHRAFSCAHVNVSTYQAVSGAGREALDSLRTETSAILAGDAYAADIARAFNCWSHESAVDDVTGSNAEEEKVIQESARILDEELSISVTCIRVPVERAHGESVWIEFAHPVDERDLRLVLESAPGVDVVDDRRAGRFPSSRSVTLCDQIQVGRIRADRTGRTSDGRSTRFQLWLTGDQLRKGAALNAVQIAERHPRFTASLHGINQTREKRPAPTEAL